jgi:hypothetical protein
MTLSDWFWVQKPRWAEFEGDPLRFDAQMGRKAQMGGDPL